jgi:uncharacterized protein YegP (UPF0339 family)
MAGKFEVFVDSDSFFRFRLLAPDGTVVAVSGPFEDKSALAAGISAVRECAGTGLVTDLCPAATVTRPASAATPAAVPAMTQPDCDDRRAPAKMRPFPAARGPRRQGNTPRWTTAAR